MVQWGIPSEEPGKRNKGLDQDCSGSETSEKTGGLSKFERDRPVCSEDPGYKRQAGMHWCPRRGK